MSLNLWMLVLCLCVSWAEARIWAWMLNMPQSPPKDGALREGPLVSKPTMVRYRIRCMYIHFVKFLLT